jgi:hypothetical protein
MMARLRRYPGDPYWLAKLRRPLLQRSRSTIAD